MVQLLLLSPKGMRAKTLVEYKLYFFVFFSIKPVDKNPPAAGPAEPQDADMYSVKQT